MINDVLTSTKGQNRIKKRFFSAAIASESILRKRNALLLWLQSLVTIRLPMRAAKPNKRCNQNAANAILTLIINVKVYFLRF